MLAVREASVRVGEVAWVLDYLDDLESDFSVLHRVDDIYSMPGARFLRLARRITAYAGVMQVRADAAARADRDVEPPAPRVQPAAQPVTRQDPNGPRVVPGDRAALAADPVFGALVEVGGARRG